MFVVVVAAVANGAAEPGNPAVVVVYPKAGQTIGAVDSTFILGHVPAGRAGWTYELTVNGNPAAVHRDGGFLAFVPIEPGDFDFVLEAFLTYHGSRSLPAGKRRPVTSLGRRYPDNLKTVMTVAVPQPIVALSSDSLTIVGAWRPPSGDVVLTAGERLEFAFRGTPGCQAWFSIDGVIDSMPMAETDPVLQPYWGEAVFGAGAVPDSMKLAGIYSGFWIVPNDAHLFMANITFHLGPPDLEHIARRLFSSEVHVNGFSLDDYIRLMDCEPIEELSSFRVTTNSADYPFAVEFVDSVQIVRHGPRRGYLSIFQPKGVRAMVVGREGGWYKIKLSDSHYGWVAAESVKVLPTGIAPPRSNLSSIRFFHSDDHVIVRFPLSGMHPFRVVEDDSRRLVLQLFGVTADTDWIRYDFDSDLIDLADWSQPEEGLYEFRIRLYHDLWGYDTWYEGNTFCLQLNYPPEKTHRLKDKVIVLDPGHSHDPGAIGPTGYTEAEANLGIALVLRQELERRGARVIMTRDDDRDVELYDRPAIAKANAADLFVSIHNNALPDGVNPYTNHGTSSYYYHPHSKDLARFIHAEMIKATGLPDHGFYHGNLAVNRPTQYPAVLIECAFMMIPEQEARLKTDEFRDDIAAAIRKGIEKFLKEFDNGK